MDLVDYRTDHGISADKVKWFQDVDRLKASGQDDSVYKLVDVLLIGGAPWGFTLKGGREHREPLIITKVGEGSKAASVCLQAGDELVNINAVPLSGSRQEAICLVKSSFKSLTLVVRRRNEPAPRPHSWHSAKLTEDHPEPSPEQSQDAPAPERDAKDDARSSSKEAPSVGEPTVQQQASGRSSSVSSMERVERPSQPLPHGRPLSPPKFSAAPEAPGNKRDSGFGCFSAGSAPSDPAPPGAADVVFYKGLQGERSPRYLQPPPSGNGGWGAEEPPGSRCSGSGGRSHAGPVWHVPERRKAAAPSPPPPPPPLRSDSFAATKVYPYSDLHRGGPPDDHRGPRHHEKGPEARRSYNPPPPPKKDFLHPDSAAEDYNRIRLHPNKLFSLSSTDVRLSHAPYARLSGHQRQHSDESTFYPRTGASASAAAGPPAPPQSVGSYYRSLQDLPTDAYARCPSLSSAHRGVNGGASGAGHIRYYCVTAKQPAPQAEPAIWGGRAEAGGGASQKAGKVKYPPPPPPSQLAYADAMERNGHFRPANGHPASGASSNGNAGAEEKEGPRRFSPGQPGVVTAAAREAQQEPWRAQDDQRICPKKTPLLHSLAQESRGLAEREGLPAHAAVAGDALPPAAGADPSKLTRRGDRYATTLRNEVQQKRAQLQKSRSAAALSCPGGDPDADPDGETPPERRRSTEIASPPASSDGSCSNTYKDHLKEAQARVLQATSFRRRDLDPNGTEPAPAPAAAGKPAVSRIGGRRRFALDERMHSFSLPDQIDKLGVEGEPRRAFGDRRRFFETTAAVAAAAKPAFARPAPKPGLGFGSGGAGEGRVRGRARSEEPLDGKGAGQAGEPSSRPPSYHQNPDPGLDPGPAPLSPGRRRRAMLEQQQRLGTFAEYQATWSMQRKASDAKTQGRYHSAENILDPEEEEEPVCQHQRSRSSPSADFYGQNVPALWREPADLSYLEHRRDQQGHSASRPSERAGGDGFPPPPPPRDGCQSRDAVAPHHASRRTLQPDPGDHTHHHALLPPSSPSYPRNHTPSPGVELPPQRPQLGPETTSSSLEFPPPGAQADPELWSSPPGAQLGPAPPGSALSLPAPGRTAGPDRGRRAEEEEEEEQRATADPESTSFSSFSSSSSSSSCLSLSSKPAAATLTVPSVGAASPQRLTDRPPPSMQDDFQSRPESAMEVTGAAKKVPVKIVRAESSPERQSRQYPLHADARGPSEGVGPPRPNPSDPPHPDFQSPFWGGTTDADPAGDQTQPGAPEPGWGPQSADPPCSNGTSGSEEDQKRAELVRDIMGKDKSLADILDQSRMRTTMDLMEGIFPRDEQLLEGTHQRRKAWPPKHGPSRSSEERREEEGLSVTGPLVPSSSYYSTSAPKAELLIKMKDMQEQMDEEPDSEDELDVDLAGKKQELIDSLSRKLAVLREAREGVQEDVQDNNALGEEVEAVVQRVCRPNQLDKFRMFVGDLDKVVSLLLSLSGRLARVENALNGLEDDAAPEEKRTLTEKRKLLIRQHEDAKELKENLDRRESLVYGIMAGHLSAESLADYQHFVKMKSALIIEQRKLEDKIKLGEEQLKCLSDSLPLEQRPLF